MGYIYIIKKIGNNLTCGPIKVTRMQDFFTYYIHQQTIPADITVGCQPTARRASSISDLLAPAAKFSAGGTAYSRLPCRPHRTYYLHHWPGHPSTHPHPLLFCGNGNLTPQPNQSLQKKYTSVMIRVCHSRSRFLSCMYIHNEFMTESR